MKTDDLLNLDLSHDCEEWRDNYLILKKALSKVPGVKFGNRPRASLESVLHELCKPGGAVRECSIHSIYQNGRFSNYTIGFLVTGAKESQKTISALTLYELFAKGVIYAYSVTRKGGK